MRKSVIIIWTFFLLLSICAASGDDTVYLTKGKYPMAFTLEDLVAFHQSILNDNAAVFLKLRQEGRAWLSRAGAEVHIIDTDGSDKVKIRPINSTMTMWTLQEAVRQKN